MANSVFLLLSGESLSQNIPMIEKSLPWIRGVEIRADYWISLPDLSDWSQFFKYCSLHSLKIILTLRREQEGGRCRQTPTGVFRFYALVAQLLKKISAKSLQLNYIDMDYRLYESHPREYREIAAEYGSFGADLLYSIHDFDGVPDDLEKKMRFAAENGWIPKAACMIHSSADFLKLLTVADAVADLKKVILGMGPYGFPSRILVNRMGSLWSYASNDPVQTQLGQLSPKAMAEHYRFYQITEQTRIFGIIGNPVMHSQSPMIHNARYTEEWVDGVYLPFPTDDLAVFQEIAQRLPIQALSVTVPFKEAVLPFLTEQDASVQRIGACNTLIRPDDPAAASWDPTAPPRWKGVNTDWTGFLEPLTECANALWGADSLSGKQVGVLGAGGAARAVVAALHSVGALPLVFNRTETKAVALADDFAKKGVECRPFSLSALPQFSGQLDALIQCTNAGMGDLSGVDPSRGYAFSGREIAFDLVYVPEMTLFLQRARQAGCRLIFGKQMLQAQAKEQYALFTAR